MQTPMPQPEAEKQMSAEDQVLSNYKLQFEKQLNAAKDRKERIEKLMVRRSAGRWKAEKRAKMMRRHLTATSTVESAIRALDHVNLRIQDLAQQA